MTRFNKKTRFLESIIDSQDYNEIASRFESMGSVIDTQALQVAKDITLSIVNSFVENEDGDYELNKNNHKIKTLIRNYGSIDNALDKAIDCYEDIRYNCKDVMSFLEYLRDLSE